MCYFVLDYFLLLLLILFSESLIGGSQGQRNLEGCSPWGHKEWDKAEATWHTSVSKTQSKVVFLKDFSLRALYTVTMTQNTFLYVCYISTDLQIKVEELKTTHIHGNKMIYFYKNIFENKRNGISLFYMFAIF